MIFFAFLFFAAFFAGFAFLSASLASTAGSNTKATYSKRMQKRMPKVFPPKWRTVLIEKVGFYNSLSTKEKRRFEHKVLDFIMSYHFVGMQTKVDYVDKVLVAASAIIPIFNFQNWRYRNLRTIYIFPDSFNENMQTKSEGSTIMGAIGTSRRSGKMMLSRKALHHGFSNDTDNHNTAIHEFVHLIDKMDGKIDGIPKVLMRNTPSLPWIDMIKEKIGEIEEYKSDIDRYGAKSEAEFFAIVSEYFFENPKKLEKKHPELYEMLERLFNHRMNRRDMTTQKEVPAVHRNSRCPCGSRRRYRHCCGRRA